MTTGTTSAWQQLSGWRRQGLARRRDLLAWLLEDPAHQGLSAKDIGERCPVYGNVDGNPYQYVMRDLNAMQDFDCTVLASRNRPAQWSVTALGAGAE